MDNKIEILPWIPGEKRRSNIWRENNWEFLQSLKEQDSSDSGVTVTPEQICRVTCWWSFRTWKTRRLLRAPEIKDHLWGKTGTPNRRRGGITWGRQLSKHWGRYPLSIRCPARYHSEVRAKWSCNRDYPGGPVAGTPLPQCRAPRFSHWSGNWIPHAAAKTWHSQISE